MGCNNSVESKVEEVASDYTQLYISIESSSRTIMPEQISLDGLSFKLLGAKSGAPLSEVKTWNNKNEISSSAISIKPGEWNFTLNAYAAGNLILTCSKQNVFIQGVSNTISFVLDEPSEYLGSVDVTFDFPVGTRGADVKRIVAKLIQDTEPETEVDSQVLIPETYTTDSTKQFVRYQNLNVEGGYYFLRFYIYQIENANYTNFHSTYIRVEPGLESKGRENLLSISKIHNISLDLNGGSWSSGVDVPTDYSEFESLALPLDATFESSYWTSATLDGWYEMPEDGDLSDVDILTEIPIGTSKDMTLYAKWTITCNEADIQSAFDNFPEGRFDIKLSTFCVSHIDNYIASYENSPVHNNLSHDRKFVSLDFSNANFDTASFAIKPKNNDITIWYTIYEESLSIISVSFPPGNKFWPNVNHYYGYPTSQVARGYLVMNKFVQCSNLKQVYFNDPMEYFSFSIIISMSQHSYAGNVRRDRGCFDSGVTVICTDGELILNYE